jgi:hypothetical protein
MGEDRIAFKILAGDTENRPLGNPRLRYENNSRINLQKIRDWIDLAQDMNY